MDHMSTQLALPARFILAGGAISHRCCSMLAKSQFSDALSAFILSWRTSTVWFLGDWAKPCLASLVTTILLPMSYAQPSAAGHIVSDAQNGVPVDLERCTHTVPVHIHGDSPAKDSLARSVTPYWLECYATKGVAPSTDPLFQDSHHIPVTRIGPLLWPIYSRLSC
ncbi:hypothetical protein SNOG_00843 [Parastagonospora nodorum SN15]|uniref:Uncharacterized protein n=1 Tax=Phaeosphaeria nodorum (strain SN15 / ATCC MYA-4574 / FGSC 10173) TaxID=321614 RepID=Q0V571_PHANO|nr:hypothetical protein SNOG_00843 [Parastagonospora nodorum SN15]EAT92338.1 hypothetical protein SNOG_00843 [Parastagonospora nodorum SN15]